MAGSEQVSQYTEKTGPIFVGRRIWQNPELAKPQDEAASGDESVEAEVESSEEPAVESNEPNGAEDAPDAEDASEVEGAPEDDETSED